MDNLKTTMYRSCPNCGSNNFIVLFESNIKDIKGNIIDTKQLGHYGRHVKCLNCGMIYVNPIEREDKIRDDYIEGEIESALDTESRLFATISQVKLLKRYKNGGKLLDIGCGEGFFLYNASKVGFLPTGIEISKTKSSYGNKYFGLNIIRKSLTEINFPNYSFDAVTLWQVLEHLPYPLETLKEISRILKPGGVIIVSTPNISGIPARILKKRWWNIRRPHINQFTPKTLRNMLKNAGFIAVSSASYKESISLMSLIVSLLKYLKIYKKFEYHFHPGSFLDKIMFSSSSNLDLTTAVGFKPKN